MAQVSLQINGYGYFLGCADGEEDHLHALAADLDRRIEEIKVSTGPSGEARLLLMAALMLSDELYELRQQYEGASPAPAAAKSGPKIGRRLRGMAKRAEEIADGAGALPLSPAPEQPEQHTQPEQDTSEPKVSDPGAPEHVAAPPEQP